MFARLNFTVAVGGLVVVLLLGVSFVRPMPAADPKDAPSSPRIGEGTISADFEWHVPRERWKMPFKDDQPVYFVNRNQAPDEWDKLPRFWNEITEKAIDPNTHESVTRKAVKIKVPLGLTTNPPVPAENPMTVAKWKLGKQLYFSGILSSDGTVSCSSCHDPKRGYTDQAPV